MIETGAISYSGSSRTVIIDTPVGIVEAKAEINDGEVKEVMIKNIPSFLLRSDVSVDVKGLGKIQADIAFAGNFFYAQVDADKLQLSLDSENKNQLISLGLMMREAINQTIPTVHPEDPEIKGVSAVDFFGKPTHREAHYRDIPGCLKSLAVR
jgi:proline racemase